MISENDVINIIYNEKKSKILKKKDSLKSKVNFLIKNYNIELNAIILGLSYVKSYNKITLENIEKYTLVAIILAHKYLSEDNYKLVNILKAIDISYDEYLTLEINMLENLNWSLSKIDKKIIYMYPKLTKNWE